MKYYSGPRILTWSPDRPNWGLAGDILSHLQRLLNTRRGSAPASPTYGLPDLHDLIVNLPETAARIAQRLAESIAQGEPRLCDVYVVQHKSIRPDVLRFDISARLVRDRSPFAVRSYVGAGSKVWLS